MAGPTRPVHQSRHQLPSPRYTNESPVGSRRSSQGHAQGPSRTIDHDLYDQVPRGPLFHVSWHLAPPLQPHGLLDTHHESLRSPHGTAHFINPREQFPVPICVGHMAFPHGPVDDLEAPPPYDSLYEGSTVNINQLVRTIQLPATPQRQRPATGGMNRASNRSAEAEQIESTRADAASQLTNRLSSSTVEEIFTDGAAPVPAGQELPRNKSPPRPTMPPWELVGESNALGLHDRDIVETVVINGIPFTALRRSPKHAGTMNSLSSGTSTLSDMVLLELPEVNPSDTPAQRKVRDEMRAFLRAVSTSLRNMVLHSSHETDGMEEPKGEEPKGKERARDEPIAEQSSAPSLSAPESQRQNNAENPFHASSSTMKFYVRKRQSTGSTIVPPSTACAPNETREESSANYPPQTQNLMLQQVPPLSTQAEVHTPPQAQSRLRTQYLTPEAHQRAPRSGLPLFATNSETGHDRLFAPAEQAKYDYLSRISPWGGSSGVGTPSMSERTIIGSPCGRGSHSVYATPSGGGGDSTVVGSPVQLVMSPKQMPDGFTVKQNLGKTEMEKETQPSTKFLAAAAPQASLLLGRSDQDPLATPKGHVETVPQEANESRESVEANLRFNVDVLARQCLREAETMTMALHQAFARCDTLSSEALDSARSTHVSLSMALTATLGPLSREVDMNIDLTDNHQLSWRDRYEEMVASMHRAINRASGLLNEFPRGDRVGGHLASVSAVAERLDYLTRQLEIALTIFAWPLSLNPRILPIRKAKIAEEARRETFQTFSDRKKMETEGLRQRMNQLKAHKRAPLLDPNPEESGLESNEG
ncbi:hypothetical protein PAXINDRAFT_155635 [Paxillus involutus ATCC 200175]|uniref:Uncharacterized protein n=1 Tax=Paxillus involutus ATCC 200175 TaxID=664439 RepID=A0A0C9U9R2_PAXIN|nr:hypothetical protein PAXINDRAFT_155635 [Paxillus involutus ATCC 200175]